MPERVATWLANDAVLLVFQGADGDASVVGEDGEQGSLETHSLDLGESVLHVLVFPRGMRHDRGWRSLSIGEGSAGLRLTADELESAPLDLKTFLRTHLTPLRAATRN